jgi:hypothetical protein
MERGERTTAIFRLLAGRPQGVSTPELAMTIDGRRDQYMLSNYGQIMRRHEAAGRVNGDRWTPAPGWKHPPARVWTITPLGEKWLAARTRTRPAKTLPRPDRKELLATARELYGPGTPRETRQPLAVELRKAGCFLQEIAAVFGVSGETIRLDLQRTGVSEGDHHVSTERVFKITCSGCPLDVIARSARESTAIRRAHLALPDLPVGQPAPQAESTPPPARSLPAETRQQELTRLLQEQLKLDTRITELLGIPSP